jgi:hypothetical protein
MSTVDVEFPEDLGRLALFADRRARGDPGEPRVGLVRRWLSAFQ